MHNQHAERCNCNAPYAFEHSPEENMFFGYAILNNDLQNAGWGVLWLRGTPQNQMRSSLEVDREFYWTPKRAGYVERITGRD